jgi:hypothetical protein
MINTVNKQTFFQKIKNQKTNKMKKIYSFLAVLFLVGMASPVVAQENPCINFKNPVFGTPVSVSPGMCKVDFTYTLVNDVSDPNPKPAFVEVFIDGTNTIIGNQCKVSGSAPAGATYTITTNSYPCGAVLKWRVTRYTASNGNCQGGVCGYVLVLPLDVTKFAGKKQGQSVVLDWTATKEIIEEGEWFGVERSADARNFISVASVTASSQQSQYSYTDNPGTGKVFYRLALHNNNGGRKYSNIIAVATDARGPKIEVPQNSGIVRLTMLAGAQGAILDMTGRSLQTFNVVGDFTSVNLKDFSPGTYMIRCITRDGEVVIQKFIR